jgi:hypothetical protein
MCSLTKRPTLTVNDTTTVAPKAMGAANVMNSAARLNTTKGVGNIFFTGLNVFNVTDTSQ